MGVCGLNIGDCVMYLNNSTMTIESSRVVVINEIPDIDDIDGVEEGEEEEEEANRYVYSIHLNSNHNYFINNGILVHNSYEIYVKTLAENLILIDVDNNDTVMYCKKKVENNCGIGCYLQKLVFNGIELENECKISDYGIKDESSIHLMLSLRSGPSSTNYGIDHVLYVILKIILNALHVIFGMKKNLLKKLKNH